MDPQKRRHGVFYTAGNPFIHQAFATWLTTIDSTRPILEPFAGSGAIPRLVAAAGYRLEWARYDIDRSIQGVEHRDSLIDFPTGYDTVITNPPYLSFHFAKRKGVHLEKAYFHGLSSLYQVAIVRALDHCANVAMIIPESFITSGLFRDRLSAVVSLPYRMFDDTEMPTCLALWQQQSTNDFQVWRGEDLLGMHGQLSLRLSATRCASRISFNRPDGAIGLRAIDNTQGATIAFCAAVEIPVEKIKHSARLVSRIHIDTTVAVEEVIVRANEVLMDWRQQSRDVGLTAFKGIRADGAFRRRLDFENARRILSQTLCELQGCIHESSS